jgi:LAO/AO transport system kinase
VDIARLAHTTLVVEAPGLGDDIQAIKAGILEIADILVVNKADRPGVDQTERALKNMLQLAHPTRKVWGGDAEDEFAPTPSWETPIQRTVATTGEGVSELVGLIESHRLHLNDTGDLNRRDRARLEEEVRLQVEAALVRGWKAGLENGQLEAVLEKVFAREISPRQAADSLVGKE